MALEAANSRKRARTASEKRLAYDALKRRKTMAVSDTGSDTGSPYKSVASDFGVDPSTVWRWERKIDRLGVDPEDRRGGDHRSLDKREPSVSKAVYQLVVDILAVQASGGVATNYQQLFQRVKGNADFTDAFQSESAFRRWAHRRQLKLGSIDKYDALSTQVYVQLRAETVAQLLLRDR